MKNRYGEEYWFEEVEPKTYRFHMEDNAGFAMRMGGREGQEQLDMKDLGFFDPSGGPFVQIGSIVDGKAVTRISSREDGIYVDVE
jgi:hypothetical protein